MIHSEGPWKEEIDDFGDVWVRQDEGHRVFIGNLEDSCGTCHANSRIMVAAPDMLKALESALQRLITWQIVAPELWGERDTEVLREVNSALALAKLGPGS